MIVDFQADLGHAVRHAELYDIVDAATGRSMADQPIFYADDETGVYCVYLRDADGHFPIRSDDPMGVAWEKRRGKFRFVLKAEPSVASEAPPRAESWRDRPPFL
jgi:hypothetical protein